MENARRSAKQAKRFMWGGGILSAVIGGIVLLVGYWALVDRSPPIDTVSGEVVEIIRRADGSKLMWVEWRFRRLRTCTGQTSRWLTDGVVQPLPSSTVSPAYGQEVGQMTKVRVAVEIPSYFH